MSSKNTTSQPRKPAGAPDGGQYTTKTHSTAVNDLEETYLPYDTPPVTKTTKYSPSNYDPEDPDLWANPFPKPGQAPPDYLLKRYSPDWDTWSEVLAAVTRETNANTSLYRSSAQREFRETVIQETMIDLATRLSKAINGDTPGPGGKPLTRGDNETREEFLHRCEAWRRHNIRYVTSQTKKTLMAAKVKGNAMRADIHREAGVGDSRKLSGAQITGRAMLIEKIDQYREEHGRSPSEAEKMRMWQQIRANGTKSFRDHATANDWAVMGLIRGMRSMGSTDKTLAEDTTMTLGDTLQAPTRPGMSPKEARDAKRAAEITPDPVVFTKTEIAQQTKRYVKEIGLQVHEKKLDGYKTAYSQHVDQIRDRMIHQAELAKKHPDKYRLAPGFQIPPKIRPQLGFTQPGVMSPEVAEHAMRTVATVDDFEQAMDDLAAGKSTAYSRAIMCMYPPVDEAHRRGAYREAYGFFAWMRHEPAAGGAVLPSNDANQTPYDVRDCLHFFHSRMQVAAGLVDEEWGQRFEDSFPVLETT